MWRSTKSERIISATCCYDSYSVSWWPKNTFNKNGSHIWPLQHPVCLLPTLVNAASAPWPLWLKVWENPNNSNMSSSETLEGFKFLQKTYSHSPISSKCLSGCCTAHEPASADRCAEGCPCSSHHQDPPEDTQAHFIMHQITFSLYKSYRCLHRLRLAKKNILLSCYWKEVKQMNSCFLKSGTTSRAHHKTRDHETTAQIQGLYYSRRMEVVSN